MKEENIFKRLVRVLVNQYFVNEFPSSEVQHLIKQDLDHAPIQLSCNTNSEREDRLFRFLKFWTKHNSFQIVVRKIWCAEVQGNTFRVLQEKTKTLNTKLVKWSKETYGNIF